MTPTTMMLAFADAVLRSKTRIPKNLATAIVRGVERAERRRPSRDAARGYSASVSFRTAKQLRATDRLPA